MPPAIFAAVATAASSLGTAVGLSTGAALAFGTAVAGVLKFAVPLALSLVASLLLRPAIPKPSAGQQEVQQPVPARVFHYGRVKVAGPLAFYEARTDGVKFSLFKIVLLCSRKISAVVEHFLTDKVVTIGAWEPDWVDDDQYWKEGIPRARIVVHDGDDEQEADAVLQSVFTEWTENHRLRGTAYAMCQFRQVGATKFNSNFPNGEPTYNALIDGALVYDPRKDSSVAGGDGAHRHEDQATWEFSDNPTLCTLDYLTYADGYDRPLAKMDLATFIAKANVDDDLVTLKGGGEEKRYRIATSVILTEPRRDVLARLLEAGDAHLYPTVNGKIGIRGGQWEEPTVTLDADEGHIIEANFSNGIDALSRYNELAFQYMSPVHGYSEVEGDPWQDVADIAATGLIETRPFDLFQVPSHGQARRLAKLRIARDNPDWIGTIRTTLVGLSCMGERVVTIKWPELGIDGPFWIESDAAITEDGTGTTMKLRTADPTSYDWDPETEEGTAPEVPPDTSPNPVSEYGDAQALFDAMDVQPSPTRKFLISQAFVALHASTAWAKLKVLTVFAAHDAQAGLLNWTDPDSYLFTAVSAPAFTVDRGYAGNGTSSYLDLGAAPSAIAGLAQDSLAVGVGVQAAGAVTNNVIGAPSTVLLTFNPRTSGGNVSSRLNNAAADTEVAASRVGRWAMSRTSSPVYERFLDGAGHSSELRDSTALASDNVYLLNNTGTFADDRLSYFYLASGLTAGEVADIDAALEDYLTGVGA